MLIVFSNSTTASRHYQILSRLERSRLYMSSQPSIRFSYIQAFWHMSISAPFLSFSFDYKSDVFNGPFDDGEDLIFIEQQQADKPLFVIHWYEHCRKGLTFLIYNPSKKTTRVSSASFGINEVSMYDMDTWKWINRYNLKSDGSLGSPILDK